MKALRCLALSGSWLVGLPLPTRRDVVADEEVSLFSDEVTVNCAPLV